MPIADDNRKSAAATALYGMRVLDISTLFAAPLVAAILGDFGADVVKVELPEGDELRRIGPQRGGESVMWTLANRNKRGITLDHSTPEGRTTLERLLSRADVVVDNSASSALDSLGATFEELAPGFPHLVRVSVSCFGRSGPRANRPGNGTLAEAFAGLWAEGAEGRDATPKGPRVRLGDLVTAVFGALGAVIACYHLDVRGGAGQRVDVSMFEPMLYLLGPSIVTSGIGSGAVVSGSGVRAASLIRDVYRCHDGRWVMISATTNSQLRRLAELVHREHLHEAKSDHAITLGDIAHRVAEWATSVESDPLCRHLESARVPAVVVHDLESLIDDPQVIARGSVTTIEQQSSPALRMVKIGRAHV